MPALFVTGTGTEIGKTYVTASIVRKLRADGAQVRVLKPVISGFDPDAPAEGDTGVLLAANGEAVAEAAIDRTSPWRYRAPLSPDMAAAREGRAIPFETLVAFSRKAARGPEDWVLIEGVGGVMVPLDDRHTVCDWIQASGLPALVVAGTYLGTISHTLTALAALRAAAVPVAGLVLSESIESPVAMEETASTIGRFAGDLPISCLARGDATAAALDALLRRLA